MRADLALDHQEEFATSLARTVAARHPGESALAALRRAVADATAAQDPVAGFSGHDFARMVADSPTLTTCLQGLHEQRERHLAQALAEATGAKPDDITVQTAAGLVGTLRSVGTRPVRKCRGVERRADCLKQLRSYRAKVRPGSAHRGAEPANHLAQRRQSSMTTLPNFPGPASRA
ncbi:hypothetical protein [Streptomyces sp. MspMP-M5]|uniref:hypothetical protein n=1 Tax=unclassified Streptomyces TaxID=2593676 RepID=UPI0003A2B09A|nr:hypothetical protein [Streptomyces sp. MspMP-M5]